VIKTTMPGPRTNPPPAVAFAFPVGAHRAAIVLVPAEASVAGGRAWVLRPFRPVVGRSR